MIAAVDHPRAADELGYTLRIEGERALLYHRHDHHYSRCSAAQAFLLTAAVELPVARALSLLAGRVGEDAARTALTGLWRHGLFQDDQRFRGRVIELEPLAGAWAAPLVVHLGVTGACNMACAHCYARAVQRPQQELDLASLRALVEELAALGCMKLVLGGGEPLLRRELPALVRHADARGVDCFVHTNGAALTPALLEELAGCPPAGLAVSLDGHDAASNDAIRGAGAFARASAGLDLLRRHYPPGFNIATTITPRSARRVAALVTYAHAQGAGVLLLRPAYPAGGALQRDELVCDRDSFARAVELARPRAEALGFALDAPHPDDEAPRDFDGFGCVAGRVVLGVRPDGQVLPCLNLPDDMVAGRLGERSLAEIWRHGEACVRLRALRPPEPCQGCDFYQSCRGGCRVRARWAGDGIGGRDPWCRVAKRGGSVI